MSTPRGAHASDPRPRRRVRRALGATMLVLGIATAAQAVPITPTQPDGTPKIRGGSLTEVGPIAEHGFPAWYRDSSGIRVEPCVTLDDPLCSALPDEVPNPDAPISFPENFPGEVFYQLAGATVVGNGVDLTIGMDLEGAFASGDPAPGDNVVFGRVRIRDKTIADGEYRITHPYGVDVFTVAGDGINATQDVGIAPGQFGGALGSRIGPFLRWDPAVAPAAPAGYLGDPAVEHRVVGSPYGTNYVGVERKDAAGAWVEIARTDLFTVQGRLATNAGVDVTAATYSVGADGTGHIDVFASSEPGRAIEVQDGGLGFRTTPLRGEQGRYHARVAVDGSPDGRTITVANVSDKPVAQKVATLTDVVTVHRVGYDADNGRLRVEASSSDQDSTPASLTVLGQPLVGGVVEITTHAPPPQITVVSDKGGRTTVPVSVSGQAMVAPPPVAAPYASPSDASRGQRVTLTGTGSTGQITAYAWRQIEAPGLDGQPVPITDANRVTLTGDDAAVASFTAPTDWSGLLAFELVVTGPTGSSWPATVIVNVLPPPPDAPPVVLTAVAGSDQVVRRGAAVPLDGSASLLAQSFAWSRVSGPAVTITGATTPKPTVTFPLMALPTNTAGPNTGYAVSNPPLVLRLTVTGPGGATAFDDVTITPQPETMAITAADYRAGREWRVSGTSSILAGQRVAVMLGGLQGRVLGTTTVDALGAWTFRGAGAVAPGAATTVSVVSATGGSATGFVFRRR